MRWHSFGTGCFLALEGSDKWARGATPTAAFGVLGECWVVIGGKVGKGVAGLRCGWSQCGGGYNVLGFATMSS